MSYGYDCYFQVGKVYPEDVVDKYKSWRIERMEPIDDLPDTEPPRKFSDVRAYCQRWINFASSKLAQLLGEPAKIFRPVLYQLRESVDAMPDAPTPPESRHVNYLSYNIPLEVAKELKRWRDWAAAASVEVPDRNVAEVKSSEQPAEQPDKETLTLQEVTERLERLCKQGEKYTSQHKLAAQIGCSPAQVNKAFNKNDSLRAWMNSKPGAAPKAQSINPVVTDRTAQSTEPDPADDAAIREYLERENLTPEERAFFNSLSRENQLMFLNDPDKHRRILSRKP
jgi:hypothetical protein